MEFKHKFSYDQKEIASIEIIDDTLGILLGRFVYLPEDGSWLFLINPVFVRYHKVEPYHTDAIIEVRDILELSYKDFKGGSIFKWEKNDGKG